MTVRHPKSPRTNAQWTAATVDALLHEARQEFAKHGYGRASVERIAEGARLTKGAIYYHFGSKQGLFEAVFRDVERDIVERIEARARASDGPLEAVVAGCEAFLDVAIDDELRTIALADAPAVLGWTAWRTIDEEFGLGSLIEGLDACVSAGLLADADTEMLAHLISGSLNEAVFFVASAPDRGRAHARAKHALTRLIRAAIVR